MPAGGAEVPTFLSYSTEKKLCKYPDESARARSRASPWPQAANNASAAGTLVPLLTLGLPTSATAAISSPASSNTGYPGPLLFAEKPDLVWALSPRSSSPTSCW
ncbi:tripartite tricarboxylate transporter permease [Bosea thiooxidans]